MDLETWQRGMFLLIETASQSQLHGHVCLSEVLRAVDSLNLLVQRNCNETLRVEHTQTILHAK